MALLESHAVIMLIVVMATAVALRLYLFDGFAGLDDGEYARFAYHLAFNGHFPAGYTGPAVFPLRVGTILPTAAVYWVGGFSEWTTVLYPFVISLLEILLVYAFTGFTFGRGAGVIAAALMATFVWDIRSSTILLPDLPASFFAAAGVTLLAMLQPRTSDAAHRLFAGGVVAGACFGLSWLCKETIAYLVPFCGLWMLMSMRRDRVPHLWIWTGVAVGAGAVLLGESFYYASVTGDPLFRFHEIERNYKQWTNGFFNEGSNTGWQSGTSYRDALIDRLFVSGPKAILFEPSLYFFPAIGVAATVVALLRRDRAFYIPGLWLCSLVLMFNFGSSSSSSYQPLTLFTRYLYPIFFPAVAVVAGTVWRLLRAEAAASGRSLVLRRSLALATMAVISVGAVPSLYFQITSSPTVWWEAEVRTLHPAIEPDARVYSDALTLRGLEYFNRYPARTEWVEFDDMGSAEIPAGSWIIVNDSYIKWLDLNAGMWLAWPSPGPMNPSYPVRSFYTQPPPNWQLVLKTDHTRVYRAHGVAKPMASGQPPS
jgi:4-amino-4-deoxy-L-arabinose transferase-like glycosyltransferase